MQVTITGKIFDLKVWFETKCCGDVDFQIGTAVLLVYSAFAALYYARYTYYTNVDYSDYDDYFFRRSGRAQRSANSSPFKGLSPTEYQRVMDAVDGAKFKSPASS